MSAFFITANKQSFNGTVLTNLSFTLDGSSAGTFTSNPGPSADYDYGVLGFSQTSLKNESHELVISTTGDSSLMLFDYLTYR